MNNCLEVAGGAGMLLFGSSTVPPIMLGLLLPNNCPQLGWSAVEPEDCLGSQRFVAARQLQKLILIISFPTYLLVLFLHLLKSCISWASRSVHLGSLPGCVLMRLGPRHCRVSVGPLWLGIRQHDFYQALCNFPLLSTVVLVLRKLGWVTFFRCPWVRSRFIPL